MVSKSLSDTDPSPHPDAVTDTTIDRMAMGGPSNEPVGYRAQLASTFEDDGPGVDLREALYNDGEVGPASAIQLPLERITRLTRNYPRPGSRFTSTRQRASPAIRRAGRLLSWHSTCPRKAPPGSSRGSPCHRDRAALDRQI